MEVRTIPAEVAIDYSNFLTAETLKKIENNTAWMLGAFTEKNEITGTAVFEVTGSIKDAIRISYLYVLKEYRDEGISVRLLEYAREQFYPKGIRRFLCSLTGTFYDIFDWSTYLPAAGFHQLEQIWHVYSYNRKQMLETPAVKKVLANKHGRLSHMQKDEVTYLLRMDRSISQGLKDTIFYECSVEKSYFEFENDELMAAVLVNQDEAGGMDVMQIYIHPQWKNKEKLLDMLLGVIQEADESEMLHLAVTSDQILALYRYLFGLPEKDFWILSYEKELKEEM